MVTPTNHVIARAGFTLHIYPRHSGDFRNIFLPNTGEDQKKVLPTERRACGLCNRPMVNTAEVIALRSRKRLDEGLR